MSGRAGAVLVILGGAAFLGALMFLDYGKGGTMWDYTTREPAILTVVAIAATGLAAASLSTELLVLPLLAACCSFYLFGRVFPIGAPSYRLAATGFWVLLAASVTMSLGGVLATVRRSASRWF
jgi:hypothetical protein